MKGIRRAAAVVGLAAGAFLAGPAAPAAAHPLGNFTVNLYSGITVVPGEVRVAYVLDMAEIPTFQELRRIDADGDGLAEEPERGVWARATAGRLLEGLSLEAGGRRVRLRLLDARASLRPGQGGLETLRLDAAFAGPVPRSGRATYRDVNFRDRIGWREVTATGARGIAVRGSTVPVASVSDALRAYPDDLLSSPLDVRAAAFGFGAGVQEPGIAVRSVGSARPGAAGGALAALVARPDVSLPVVLLSLAAAFGLGALHALAPGHGKTITAAYLVGAGGRARQAVGAGLAVAVMHTASVLALGVLVVAAERAFPPERVYPWLGIAAGVAATALGAGLLASRLRARREATVHGHDHGTGRGHEHPAHRPLSRRGLAAIALSGGLLPSPSALLVLVAAVTLHRVALGVALVAVFGLGLAAALVAVGAVAVRARDAVARRLRGRFAAALPVVSAGAILVVGLAIAARAVSQL